MCILHTRRTQPAPAPEYAALALIGVVRTPQVWSLAELAGLPQSSLRATLVCDCAPLDAAGWHTHDWTGIALRDLWAAADAEPSARSIEVAGYDGALARFALEDVRGALLALKADGQNLSRAQGFPARLIVPGASACAMPRFVQRLTVSDMPAERLAPAAPRAILTHAARNRDGVHLAGWAWAGAEPLAQVAVRLDDGPPVVTDVTGPAPGVAGAWALDWRGVVADNASFSVQPVSAHSPAPTQMQKRLARRWTPALHTLKVAGR
jgi:DMSO/TMAO reductase YedYZ molybdopterin-dependent catalytic subunit